MPCDSFIKLTEDGKLRLLDDVVQDAVEHAVGFCNNNKSQAADGLGMSRSLLYRKMGSYKEYLSQKSLHKPT